MSMAELREACGLLAKKPVLWIPGIVGGLCAAILWLVLMFFGTFYAGRLLLIAGLILLFFITGALALIKNDENDFRGMLRSGWQYYFRVLLPVLFILFMILLVFILVILTLSLIGIQSDESLIVFLSFGVMIPSILLTLFVDTAAVFDDKRVFDSIQRSVELVSVNLSQTLTFFIINAVVICGILFSLMIVWEALLYAKLQPIMEFTEEQIRAFTPEQLLALIGTDGIWVTAGILFIAGLVLIPIIVTYKACFFKKLPGGTVTIQQVAGEYDSKGRWYKY
jgi:hypothetical protein